MPALTRQPSRHQTYSYNYLDPRFWYHAHLIILNISISPVPSPSSNSVSIFEHEGLEPLLHAAAGNHKSFPTSWREDSRLEDLHDLLGRSAWNLSNWQAVLDRSVMKSLCRIDSEAANFCRNVIACLLWDQRCEVLRERPQSVVQLHGKLAQRQSLHLRHASVGRMSWLPHTTLFSTLSPTTYHGSYPLLSIVTTSDRPSRFKDVAYLLSLAQETFNRSEAMECWPALLSLHMGQARLISMKVDRQGVRDREEQAVNEIYTGKELHAEVHGVWDLETVEGRQSFVKDMANWLWNLEADLIRENEEEDIAASLVQHSTWTEPMPSFGPASEKTDEPEEPEEPEDFVPSPTGSEFDVKHDFERNLNHLGIHFLRFTPEE